jgi:hypothetical protein
MSNFKYDLSGALVKRIAEKMAGEDGGVSFDQAVDALRAENVHSPAGKVCTLIRLFHQQGYSDMASMLGWQCAYDLAQIRTERREMRSCLERLLEIGDWAPDAD